MGLDTLELIWSAEERFDVLLPADELSGDLTLGQLCDCLVRHLGTGLHRTVPNCPNVRAFNLLRRGLVTVCRIPSRRVTPDTPLDGLIPRRWGRQRKWDDLSRETNLPLPPLQFPRWGCAVVAAAGLFAGLLLCAAAVALLRGGCSEGAMLLLFAPVVACVVVYVAHGVVDEMARIPPVATVGELVGVVVADGPMLVIGAALGPPQPLPTPDEVWAGLCELVVQGCNVSPADLHREARLAWDLGID